MKQIPKIAVKAAFFLFLFSFFSTFVVSQRFIRPPYIPPPRPISRPVESIPNRPLPDYSGRRPWENPSSFFNRNFSPSLSADDCPLSNSTPDSFEDLFKKSQDELRKRSRLNEFEKPTKKLNPTDPIPLNGKEYRKVPFPKSDNSVEYVIEYETGKYAYFRNEFSLKNFLKYENNLIKLENYKILNLEFRSGTQEVLNKNFSDHKIEFNLEEAGLRTEEQNLRMLENVFKSYSNSTIFLIGHIENGDYVIRDASGNTLFSISVKKMQELANKYKVCLFHLGCKSAKYSQSGTANAIDSVEILNHLKQAIGNGKNFTLKEFIVRLTSKDMMFVFDRVTLEEMRFNMDISVFVKTKSRSKSKTSNQNANEQENQKEESNDSSKNKTNPKYETSESSNFVFQGNDWTFIGNLFIAFSDDSDNDSIISVRL